VGPRHISRNAERQRRLDAVVDAKPRVARVELQLPYRTETEAHAQRHGKTIAPQTRQWVAGVLSRLDTAFEQKSAGAYRLRILRRERPLLRVRD
jgi:hypothetical protein